LEDGEFMTVLVTGGAGYIGSHVVQALTEAGESVIVIERLLNLPPGRRSAFYRRPGP